MRYERGRNNRNRSKEHIHESDRIQKLSLNNEKLLNKNEKDVIDLLIFENRSNKNNNKISNKNNNNIKKTKNDMITENDVIVNKREKIFHQTTNKLINKQQKLKKHNNKNLSNDDRSHAAATLCKDINQSEDSNEKDSKVDIVREMLKIERKKLNKSTVKFDSNIIEKDNNEKSICKKNNKKKSENEKYKEHHALIDETSDDERLNEFNFKDDDINKPIDFYATQRFEFQSLIEKFQFFSLVKYFVEEPKKKRLSVLLLSNTATANRKGKTGVGKIVKKENLYDTDTRHIPDEFLFNHIKHMHHFEYVRDYEIYNCLHFPYRAEILHIKGSTAEPKLLKITKWAKTQFYKREKYYYYCVFQDRHHPKSEINMWVDADSLVIPEKFNIINESNQTVQVFNNEYQDFLLKFRQSKEFERVHQEKNTAAVLLEIEHQRYSGYLDLIDKRKEFLKESELKK